METFDRSNTQHVRRIGPLFGRRLIHALLEAFFLSNDGSALRAVYGERADLLDHIQWLEVLKAGADAGELGRMLDLGLNLAKILVAGAVSGVRRLFAAFGPSGLLALGALGAVAATRASAETKTRVRSLASSAVIKIAEAFAAYSQGVPCAKQQA